MTHSLLRRRLTFALAYSAMIAAPLLLIAVSFPLVNGDWGEVVRGLTSQASWQLWAIVLWPWAFVLWEAVQRAVRRDA